VIALEYEAHPSMALKLLSGIVADARAAFPLRKVALAHRLGRVDLGEPTIVIAVSAAHRDEAYRASRYLIDRIKHEAPIWKREICADGTRAWSRGCTAEVHR
jgi:molybdopterin synthase catalytic subunit